MEAEFERLLGVWIKAYGEFMYDDSDVDGPRQARAALLDYHTRVVQERDARIAKLEKDAERYRALKQDVVDGELIICYVGDSDGGDIGGPESIDDWCDASVDAARKGVSDE